MKRLPNLLLAAVALMPLLVACGGAPAPASTPSDAVATDAAPVEEPVAAEAPVQPDREKFVTHANDHLSYPASRAQVLEACANTPEFTEEEKTWVADNLPEGDYDSADSVIEGVGL